MSISKLSSKGQVTIPAHIRKALGLQAGASMRVSRSGNKVVLESIDPPSAASVFGTVRLPKGQKLGNVRAALDEIRRERYANILKPRKHR